MEDSPQGYQGQKRKRVDPEHVKHRTTRACLPCRRRKTKCNGARPYCQNCLRLKDECKWSSEDDPDGVVLRDEAHESLVTESQHGVLISLFFSVPHLSIMRQSIHRPSFEATDLHARPPFLLAAIYCLSALYISETNSREVFNGEIALNLSDRLAASAQKHSRDTSDQPTVTSTQANLILGFRELLCRTGYKAWMYIGTGIRMSQALRLGREYHQRHSAREQEIRRRTLWTCFIMDRLSSVICSRPQTLCSPKLRCFLPSSESSFFFEECPGRRYLLDSGPDPESREVYPFLIKAIEYWGIMTDIFALGLMGNQSSPTDSNSCFYKTEQSINSFKENLPSRMQWTMKNYKTHRMLGQGSMFVEFHFILNHSLCVAHQEYLPEYEGDPAFESPSSPGTSGDRAVIKTCLYHADEITEMANLLLAGDEVDQQLLHGPFVGLALETAACCHLWRIFRMVQFSGYDRQCPHRISTTEKLVLICKVLKSWESVWPIAGAWSETIELLTRLYEAADPQGMLEFDLNRLEDQEEKRQGDIAIGSGHPDPRNINTSRMFDKIRLIIMTAADPSSLRHHQTRLHIQSLWTKMFMQQDVLPVSAPATTSLEGAEHHGAPTSYNEISNFDDMLNFMDDFEGFPIALSDSLISPSLSAPNPQHPSPTP